MTVLAKSGADRGDVREVGGMGCAGAGRGFNARRLRSNLMRNEAALDVLGRLGLDRAMVQSLGLGIKEPYTKAKGPEVSGVLTYPLDIGGGRHRYGCLNLEGVTSGPDHPVAWSPGAPRRVHFGSGGVLLVFASPLALFQARSAVERGGLAIAGVASSQPDRLPPDWSDPSYWSSWDRVILADGLPSAVIRAIADGAGRPVEVATGIILERHLSVSISRRLDEWIEDMVAGAKPYVADTIAIGDRVGDRVGDYVAAPISLHGGVQAGRMYYPFLVERRKPAGAGGGALLCSYQTLVLRSDGAVLEARTLPAPPGTALHQRVHSLTDGTRITAPPEPSRNSTWSLSAITSFVADRGAGRDPCRRGAGEVLTDVHAALSSRVALPHADDYWVATAFVALTHMFRSFDALPIMLIEGPKGSGKSELASAVAGLGFNSVTMGQGSAAVLVRVARECGGLVVLDDVEGLSAGGSGFGELSQCLKVGYRASTALKPIALGSGRVETFDFFGPRLLTSTRGVEPILRSRCITISTTPGRPAVDVDLMLDVVSLRDELHALGMANAAAVAGTYGALMREAGERSDEIWSPLLAIMETFDISDGLAALRQARMSRAI